MSAGAAEAPSAAGRVLGFWSLLSLGINGIVGVGIFFAPSELARLVPGPASALVFLATAVLLLPVAWVYGRLGGAYAEDGGPFVWAREAFGERFAFGVGFVAYASAVLSTAAVVSGLGQYLAPELGLTSAGERSSFQLLASGVFCGVALLGLRQSAWVWSALTVLKLLPLLLLLALAWASPQPAVSLEGEAFGLDGAQLARAALVAVFPLQGFEIVPVPSGEARGGQRSVLHATLLSLLLAAALYVALQLATVRALPQLAASQAPIVEAGSLYSGGSLRGVFAAGTNLSAIGIAFGMFAMSPRYLSALGTPALLGGWVSLEKRGVPWRALLITTAAVSICGASASLSGLFVLSSLAVLSQYAISALCLFRLAGRGERGLGRLDQFLAPFTLLALLVLAQAAELAELASLAGILLLGWVVLASRHALRSRAR